MINALIITNDTATRASVIARRTGSDFVAGYKSAMIEQLKDKMRNGIGHFLFIKKDKTIREAWGTTNFSLVRKHVNGWGESREDYATTAFFDVEKGQWRSFRWESLVKVF